MRKSCVSTAVTSAVGRLFIVLAAVSWFATPASASDIDDAARSMRVLRPGIAVADLDGDQIPDIASGIRTGHTPEGYSYQVDLDLSSNSGARPFSVVSEDSTGLKIESVDIDGDHDLDLLVSGRFSPKPIGIWLNDGRGGFTQGDLAKYVLPSWQPNAEVQSPNANRSVIVLFARRPQMAARPDTLEFQNAQFFLSTLQLPAPGLLQISTGAARFRAPPLTGI